MKKKLNKLFLNKETIAILTPALLNKIKGGGTTSGVQGGIKTKGTQ